MIRNRGAGFDRELCYSKNVVANFFNNYIRNYCSYKARIRMRNERG